MPRLTEILLYRKPLKKFTNYKYQPLYKEVLPAKLKNSVASKGEQRKVAPCLQEMSLMLACLKEHDFSEVLCSKEVQSFNNCNQEFMAAKRQRIEAEQQGVMSKGKGGKVSSKQLNELLRNYPQQN